MILFYNILQVFIVLFQCQSLNASVSSCFTGSSSISSSFQSESTEISPSSCPSDKNDLCVSVTTSSLNGKVSIVYSCGSNSTSLCGFTSGSMRRSTKCCYTNDCNTIENGQVSSCYTGASSRSTKKITIEECPPGLGHQCVTFSSTTSSVVIYGCAYKNIICGTIGSISSSSSSISFNGNEFLSYNTTDCCQSNNCNINEARSSTNVNASKDIRIINGSSNLVNKNRVMFVFLAILLAITFLNKTD